MHPMLNIAVRAARTAGDQIVRNIERVDTLQIARKQRADFVTEVDRLAEREIIAVLRKAYPDHAILAEESGASDGNDFQWIIDPLDGTTNFIHGFPQFAVSIALRHGRNLEHGVVYDPLRQELFTASRGRGAQLNSRRIRVSKLRHLEDALIGTGFPFKENQRVDDYLRVLRYFMGHSAGVRRPGAAALDLAYVAAGRLDGFWEDGLNPWDIAAGALLIREAGGLIGDAGGGEDFLESGNVLAANPHLFGAMLKITRQATPA